LLQEYAYDNYALLAEYLGSNLVDVERQEFRDEIFTSPEGLMVALREAFDESARGALPD
jgi:hypothetical protein